MSVVCEEIFDETSHPSIEEIRDYATRIGIDPDSEPKLLPLAAEGLMKALPPGWKPCYDDKSKSYYYYNNLTKKTQWEHPLDDVYRELVKKARTDSQSLSLAEPTDDATYGRDDITSYEEPPINFLTLSNKKLEPISLGAIKKDIKLSPIKTNPSILKTSPNASPKKLLLKQKSEEILGNKMGLLSLQNKEEKFSKHPRSFNDKSELKIVGGGAIFLKCNTRKDSIKNDLSLDGDKPKGILRDRLEVSKSMEFDKLSVLDKSDKEDEDKKSVRFNLDNATDNIAFTLSDKSSSEEELKSDKNKPEEPIINVKVTTKKSRFSVTPVLDHMNLKLIKPNPADFIKPNITVSKGSDSEDDSMDKDGKNNAESFFDSEKSSDSKSDSSLDELLRDKTRKLEERAEKKVSKLKQNIWEEKNEELQKFRNNLKDSHKEELERILINEKTNHEEIIKSELENLRKEMENRSMGTLKNERIELEESLGKMKKNIEETFETEEKRMKQHFETKKDELEKYYEEKLADVEKEMAEKVEKNRDEMMSSHNAIIEQLKQNHSIIIEELKREFQVEEQVLRKEHKSQMAEIRSKMSDAESEKQKSSIDERMYEKMRCEKRLLEDKYRCLKEKYLRLKTEVKVTIEKRNRKKESTNTTTNTGSETEQSNSNNKDKTPLNSPARNKLTEKPPATPKGKVVFETPRPNLRGTSFQDMDTSTSDNYQSEDATNKNNKEKGSSNTGYDSSDNSVNAGGRNKKKSFSRPKSSVGTRGGSRKPPRSCSPVENLRRQLQKLEDLEDQFPQNPQADTYHLRYPFTDVHKIEGSSELEFFRHRIHLERDSIKRAKESLRSQKTMFQQRQKELKLKHGTMARHTLQQLCQEEKELTDMEVSLHRTRSLLGEKVIRLRHLEQSLQRANVQSDTNKLEDATLSDISSHSASSGISSTEFATAADINFGKSLVKADQFQESSEIIQSLENLNSEIREIWDVLRTQQQQSSLATVLPPFVYPDLGWPLLAGAPNVTSAHSIPTLADRLHNYRQHVALANAQGTVVTHAQQGATTTLVERTRNLRHWLRQTSAEQGSDPNVPQATL